MPTLGEFIERARRSPYNFTKGTLSDPDLGRIDGNGVIHPWN